MLEHRLRGDAGTLFAGGLRFRGACRTHASRMLRPSVWRAFAGNTGAGSIAECDIAHCHALIFAGSNRSPARPQREPHQPTRTGDVPKQTFASDLPAAHSTQASARTSWRAARKPQPTPAAFGIHGTRWPHQAFRHIGGRWKPSVHERDHHKESRNRREQHRPIPRQILQNRHFSRSDAHVCPTASACDVEWTQAGHRLGRSG